MKKIFNILSVFSVAMLIGMLLVGVTVNAQDRPNPQPGPNPSGGTQTAEDTGIVYVCEGGMGECTYNDVIRAIQKLINWGIVFGLAFSVVIIAWGGGLYLISGDNPAKRKEANGMFVKVGWGIFYILAAWLIVNLIFGALVNESIPGPLK